MKAGPRHDRRDALLLLVALLAGAVEVRAQAAPVAVPQAPWPGDRVGIPLRAGGCPGPNIDLSRAPEIVDTQYFANDPGTFDDVYRHQLHYYFGANADVCFPSPPRFDALVDVGPLPEGLHDFEVTGRWNDTPHSHYAVASIQVFKHQRPGEDISGAWYAPQQPGRGVMVTRANDHFSAWWAHHDRAGEPTWLLMSATQVLGHRFEGEAINTGGAPFPGDPDPQARRWGMIAFEYLGCGRARLEWLPDDAATPSGSIALQQLVLPDGVQPCDPTPRLVGLPAQWPAAD